MPEIKSYGCKNEVEVEVEVEAKTEAKAESICLITLTVIADEVKQSMMPKRHHCKRPYKKSHLI